VARYLIDTDVIIDYLNHLPAARSVLTELVSDGETLCTCDMVLAEVYSGLDVQAMPAASEFLDATEYLVTSPAIAKQAGSWRFSYALRGIQLATADVLIAATARAHRATVVTRNVRDYPIPELTLLSLRP
jgi:predicted nucleic acid-binding protein